MERTLEQRVNQNFCVKPQKSPTDQTPLHRVDIEEFPQSKAATHDKVQNETKVDVRYHPL
jgi:hypothetical protein